MWQTSVVHLATKSIADVVLDFSFLKSVGFNVDRRYHYSVRT